MSAAGGLYRCAVGTPNQMFDPTKPGEMKDQAKQFSTHTAAMKHGIDSLRAWETFCERYDHAGLENLNRAAQEINSLYALGAEPKVFDAQVDTHTGLTIRVVLWRDDVAYTPPPKPTLGPKGMGKLPKPIKKKAT